MLLCKPRALKLGCITNVDMLFLTNEFICLFHENKFVLISGGQISNRSIIIVIHVVIVIVISIVLSAKYKSVTNQNMWYSNIAHTKNTIENLMREIAITYKPT